MGNQHVLAAALAGDPPPVDVPAAFARLVSSGALGTVPLPGAGGMAERLRALAALGLHDLALARLGEGHLDALAILAEAGRRPPSDARLGVWAAGPPSSLQATELADHSLVLSGTKRWCSGARELTHALVTASIAGSDSEQLLLVDLGREGVSPLDGSWPAVGMARTDTLDVAFDEVALPSTARLGPPGWYLARRGFWAGSIGVAAVWFGGACGVADVLSGRHAREDPHFDAHRGAVAARLWAMRLALEAAASAVDRAWSELRPDPLHPTALAVRHLVEEGATEVVERVGRASGAGPLCHDGAHAARVADLGVYLRQHHAERDLAELSRALPSLESLP